MPRSILYCVLDWGLGHAIRSLTIIMALEKQGIQVVVASSGMASTFLAHELDRTILDLPDYSIRYSKNGMLLHFLKESPRLMSIIRKEHDRIRGIENDYSFDLIISDNRYGCWSKKVPSIFISHQLIIPISGINVFLAKMHARYINRFDHCWVLDDERHRLAGEMSDPQFLKIPHSFIGHPIEETEAHQEGENILLILSGPEPNRSELEEKLVGLLKDERKVVLVRSTEGSKNLEFPHDWEIIDWCGRDRIIEEIKKSKVVIGRAGYTSLYQYLYWGIKAILIPTPGQYEQMYLGEICQKNNWMKVVNESELDGLIPLLDESKPNQKLDLHLRNLETLLDLFQRKTEG